MLIVVHLRESKNQSSQCIASVAVVGAGDYIESAIVRRSAHARADTWLPAVVKRGRAGAAFRSQRPRLPVAFAAFVGRFRQTCHQFRAPGGQAALLMAVFNIGANVKYRCSKPQMVFRKVWS